MRSIVTVLLAVTPLALQLAGRADTVPDAKEDLTRRVLDTELSIDLAAKSGVAILSLEATGSGGMSLEVGKTLIAGGVGMDERVLTINSVRLLPFPFSFVTSATPLNFLLKGYIDPVDSTFNQQIDIGIPERGFCFPEADCIWFSPGIEIAFKFQEQPWKGAGERGQGRGGHGESREDL